MWIALQPMVLFVLFINLFLSLFALLDAGYFARWRPVSLSPHPHKVQRDLKSLDMYFFSWTVFPIVGHLVLDALVGTKSFAAPTSAEGHNSLVKALIFHWDVNTQPISPARGVVEFVALLLLWDAIFYWIHRLLHWKVFARLIHVQHHTFRFSFGAVIWYVDFVDGLVNFAAIVLPVAALNPSIMTSTCYYAFTGFLGACSHSGYDCGFGSSAYHYCHHLTHRHNYGAIGLQDHLFGTYISMDDAVATCSAYWPHSEWVHRFPHVQRGAPKHVTLWARITKWLSTH